MAQNADDQDDKSSAADDSTRVTEEDLRRDKYEKKDVDDSSDDDQDETLDSDGSSDDSEEAGDEDGKTDQDTEDDDSEGSDNSDSDDDDSEFVKEFPNIKGDTLVDYARSMESTLHSSNKEGKRLSDEVIALREENQRLKSSGGAPASDDKSGSDSKDGKEQSAPNPRDLFIDQQMDEQIQSAFADFKKNYGQVEDAAEYNKFTNTVKELSITIYNTQNRFAKPEELYSKAAAALGWKPSTGVDGKEKLGVALKNRAAITKTTTNTKKAPKSRVTDSMIANEMKMFPGKTRDQIIKELEPHVQ